MIYSNCQLVDWSLMTKTDVQPAFAPVRCCRGDVPHTKAACQLLQMGFRCWRERVNGKDKNNTYYVVYQSHTVILAEAKR